ncbi:MAG TPA: tyrosine-type recombinase/integrase [Gammaproteobacteria bacterium]|nr:tyrosine-type recombinase/integrase [Gammaproteobacteria bacterium]
MGRKRRMPGLIYRDGKWHVDKQVKEFGRLCESTGTAQLEDAERFLVHRLEEIRQAQVYGIRPRRVFAEAATEYLQRYRLKRSIERDARDLKELVAYIGEVPLERVHSGSFDKFKADGMKRGLSTGTINRALSIGRRVLNLSASLWRDEHGLSWLLTAPKIELLPNLDKRVPYPLSLDEQRLLFSELPSHTAEMALFAVNSGCREQEVCRLKWSYEVWVPEIDARVFVIPHNFGGRTVLSGVKNKMDRLVVLNTVAESVVKAQEGRHAEFVFTYPGRYGNSERKPVTKVYNTAWKKARERAATRYEMEFGRKCPDGFKSIRVHDLKHSFGRRLRAAGVSLEDRQDLLGHKSARITTEYSCAEIGSLIEAANRVTRKISRKSPAISAVRLAGVRN